MEISKIVGEFNSSRNLTHRYASYDYCFNYFYKNQKNLLKDSEKSCAILGFYLASWGMMRGSSFLLQKSYKYFESLISYFANLDDYIWDLDVINYENESAIILQIYSDIKKIIIEKDQRDIVLVTKIMMGVLGISPAYDEYFCRTFKMINPKKCRFTTFNKPSLEVVYDFYLNNKDEINSLTMQFKTVDFKTGIEKHSYKQAKIIDMFGFNKNFVS
ncbi:MAG: hypothetical protein H8E33_05515 [Candidatus Cloacimonetes bacterium]|nr:hypothetical protein [Candidatus Cloacimonadota bacterium]